MRLVVSEHVVFAWGAFDDVLSDTEGVGTPGCLPWTIRRWAQSPVKVVESHRLAERHAQRTGVAPRRWRRYRWRAPRQPGRRGAHGRGGTGGRRCFAVPTSSESEIRVAQAQLGESLGAPSQRIQTPLRPAHGGGEPSSKRCGTEDCGPGSGRRNRGTWPGPACECRQP
jgi:hypothetical protein